MRKTLIIISTVVLFFSLVGCTNNTDHLNNVKTTLEGIGYVFEQRDDDAREYYNTKAVNEKYDIEVTLTDLYIGYMDTDQGWLELMAFDSENDAIDYVEGTVDSGYIVYREGNVVFITYTSDALAPFNDNSDSVKGD